ncbi:MAG: hypothetical protein WC003_11160 [Terrimicrobiaceae bacterium]
MDISLINSRSLLHLLRLTEKKEELLQTLEEIDAEIIGTLRGGISVEVFEVASAPKALPPTAAVPTAKTSKKAKAGKKKSGITPEGRAKLAANMKARWAARKAGKPAATKTGKPAKKGFKLPKVNKNPL